MLKSEFKTFLTHIFSNFGIMLDKVKMNVCKTSS